jgi:hypothetical protein
MESQGANLVVNGGQVCDEARIGGLFQGADSTDDANATTSGFSPSVTFVDEEKGRQFYGEADRRRFAGV